MLSVLKDSRIGAHGALALILSTLIRWQALSAIALDPVPALAAAQGLSRVSAVALAWITPPAGSGLGFVLSNTMTTPVALIAIAQGALLAAWCGGRLGLLLAAGIVIIVFGARRYFLMRLGGVNGDCLGATAHVVEMFCLVLFTCRSCTL
jgi:adenosylcobinamide-GDP ribazoletransferase